MNIESLRYFSLIAKAGNISSVAKEVHLTQSALSQQIQKLESDLNKKLLSRSNKGVSITPTGEIVSMYADNILRTYDKMFEELAATDKSNTNIKIEACHSVADYALPCTLILANGVHTDHKYALSGNASPDIVTNVTNNICDVGFICSDSKQLKYDDIVAKKVGLNNVVLVGSNDDSVPDKLTVGELLDTCLITFTYTNYITNVLSDNLKKLGYDQSDVHCALRVEGIEGAKMLISRKFGLAFLPYISVKEELYKKQFKIIELPCFDMDIDIMMLHKTNCPQHVKDFIDWFSQNGSNSFC